MTTFLHSGHLEELEIILSTTTNPAYQRRAQLLLGLEKGFSISEVSTQVGLAESTVRRWQNAYLKQGLAVFPDLPTPPSEENGQVEKARAKENGNEKAETVDMLEEAKEQLRILKKKGKKKPIKSYLKQLKRQRKNLMKYVKDMKPKKAQKKKYRNHLESLDAHISKARKVLNKIS